VSSETCPELHTVLVLTHEVQTTVLEFYILGWDFGCRKLPATVIGEQPDLPSKESAPVIWRRQLQTLTGRIQVHLAMELVSECIPDQGEHVEPRIEFLAGPPYRLHSVGF
jgi:hypothetical protein